jgi:integrase/recombinase XerD
MKTHLERAEIELMEQASTCIRDELLIEILYRLGCRVSEALALRVEDIDLVRGLVTIIHLKSRLRLLCPECRARLSKTARYCAACGKIVDAATMRETEHRRLRTLPLDPKTLDLLKNYIKQGGPVCKHGKKLIRNYNLWDYH